MKPISPSSITGRLVRHDDRAGRRRTHPPTDYFFHAEGDATLSPAAPHATDPARSAFRRMSAEMIARLNEHERLELIVCGIVTAIMTWPLAWLLIVLAQTANG